MTSETPTAENSTASRVIKILVRVLFVLCVVVYAGILMLFYFIEAWPGSVDPAVGWAMMAIGVVGLCVLTLLWRWSKWGK